MIQRVQSLYLLLTTILSVLFLNGSILNFIDKAGSTINVTFSEVLKTAEGQPPELVEKLLPLTILIILIPVVAMITIFLFKNRKLQMKSAIFLIVLTSLLMIAFIHVSMSVMRKFDASMVFGFRMILPLIMLLLSILAYRGIKKDDKLVKSYDRLR